MAYRVLSEDFLEREMKFLIWAVTFLAVAAVADDVVVPVNSVEQHINVRMEADAASEIVGRLRQGDSLPFKRTVEGWHEVRLDDEAYGYASADWSVVISAEAFAARLEAPADSDAEDSLEAVAESVTVDVAEAAAAVTLASTVVDEEALVETPAVDEQLAASSVDSEVEQSEPVEPEAVQAKPSESAEPIAEPTETEEAEAVTADNETAPSDPAESIEAADESAVSSSASPIVALVPTVVEGPMGPMGPPGPPGAATVEGTEDFLMKFTASTIGGNSQVFDNGRNVGIGTNNPKQRLEVNGNIQIHEQNSNVAGLMLTQASGDMGYIMHNRANTLTLGAGSVDRLTIDGDGNVGIGTARPSHPIEMASGAYVSAGGVWTNSSSRERKENIAGLTPEEALSALAALEPVRFNYLRDDSEEYVGFIAEDVPELVASSDRKSLSTMDIVAVLTKVVQQQQEKIAELEARFDEE